MLKFSILICSIFSFFLTIWETEKSINFDKLEANGWNVLIDEELLVMEDTISNMDIFLLIGQSNMAGRGELADLANIVLTNVYLFNGIDWQPAYNPLNQFSTVKKDVEQGLSPGFTFGRKLAENFGNPIGLVVNARGGTSLQQWQKGYEGSEDFDLFEEAVSQSKKAGRVKGIIWHQGESNQYDSANYLELLKKLVFDLRNDLGDEELIFVAGELGQWRFSSEKINEIIRNIAEHIPRAYYVSADHLTPLNNDPKDPHFDGLSQQILGERYAEKVTEVLRVIGDMR